MATEYSERKHANMCPHCGSLHYKMGLIPYHVEGDSEALPSYYKVKFCPGSMQNPRNPDSDRRLLWNGKVNPHATY